MKSLPDHVPSRVVVEGVEPAVDDGRFPARRTVGEDVTVAADIHADGHEVLASVVEHGLGYLDDAWRMATPDTPIPYSPPLEQAFLPGPGRIAAEVRERLR